MERRNAGSTTSPVIFAFTCLEAMDFYQVVVRGLNMGLSGDPSNENICSREAGRRREPVDRLTPPKESGFPQSGSDSFASRLYIAIDRRGRIRAWRGVPARSAQFPSSGLDVEFVHSCLIQLAALTPARSKIERCGGVIGLFLGRGRRRATLAEVFVRIL